MSIGMTLGVLLFMIANMLIVWRKPANWWNAFSAGVCFMALVYGFSGLV